MDVWWSHQTEATRVPVDGLSDILTVVVIMPKVQKRSVKPVQQGISFNKDLGQHILKNPLVITSMIEKVRRSRSWTHRLMSSNLRLHCIPVTLSWK